MFFSDVLPFAIPILALLIPIIVILTNHQRRMAELLHKNQQQPQIPSQDLVAMRQDIYELKQLVHQQAIALDNLTNSVKVTSVEDRLHVGAE
jgi:hypothetical protein